MDSKPFFDSIYDKMVLRDLVGKVVPGTVFMVAMALGVAGLGDLRALVDALHWTLLIAAVGVAWLLAFALQYFGELFRILRTHPGGPSSTRDEFFASWANFHDAASESQKIHAERLNVIKEACGNGAMALWLAVPLVAIGQLSRGSYEVVPMCFVLTLAALAGFALWRMHLIHLERYGAFVRNVAAWAASSTKSEHAKRGAAANQPDSADANPPLRSG